MIKNENFNKISKFVLVFIVFDASGIFDLLIITYKSGYYNTMMMISDLCWENMGKNDIGIKFCKL